jgi:hypothetical protein
VRERYLLRRGVDAGDPRPKAQVDAVIGVPPGWVDVDRLALGLALQVALGQRRSLVWAVALRSDQQQRAVEALCPQVCAAVAPARLAPTIR